MGNAKPTVVIIDDSAEVRALIRTQLRLSGLLEVVADGADGNEAIGLAYQHRPSLVLLDMSMPTLDGLDALPGILTVSPKTRIVVFSGFQEQGLADRARELGASAFIEKSTPVEALPKELMGILIQDDHVPGDSSDPPGLSIVRDDPDSLAVRRTTAEQDILDEHLERFREIFDEAAIGMATLTLTGSIVRANRALGELAGQPHHDLVGVEYAALTAGSGDTMDEALVRINEHGANLVQVEHDVSGLPDRRRVMATLAPVRDSQGQALYLFLQVQDITAQREAEDELRQSEERFRLLTGVVAEYAIFMLSPGGIVISWNAGAERNEGYTADEIIGKHFRTFYRPEQRAAHHPEHELELALRDGHYMEEGWRVRKDGSEFWASVLITAVFDSTGHHVGFAKVTQDITQQRHAQETLRQSEERFRLLVEAVRDYAIFMLDPSGHVVSWNAGAQRSTGYTMTEIVGHHFHVFYPPDLRADGHPEQELRTALREGRYEEEGWRVRKDGSRYWANVVITAVFNDSGEHIGFAKVVRDTSDQRRARQERAQAAAALEAANRSLEDLNQQLRDAAADQSQFLAVTAHELRTPVGVLGGSADMLAKHWDELSDDERTELFDAMSSSSMRLRRLLNDLLTASRLDSHALRLYPVANSLNDIIRKAVKTVQAAEPTATLAPDLGTDIEVLADHDRLAQAVDNFLTNAFRHGAPPVRIQTGTQDGMAFVRVSDSGSGVPAANHDRLFERFATGDLRGGGTGLGLFIARELARAHGGDAIYEPGAEDSPAGSFVLTVPLA